MWRVLAAACVALAAASCSRATERPSVVLIILDTVRRDFTGLPGSANPLISTPCLNQVGAEGTVFTAAWANSPWTLPSHISLFTGLLPFQHGVDTKSITLESKSPTLAELLSDAGYDTVAFFSNPWLLDSISGAMRGFREQHVVEVTDFQMLKAKGFDVFKGYDQGGPELVREISRWLETRDSQRPFFLFLNLLEAHLPYKPPPDYCREHLADMGTNTLVTVQWAYEFNAGLHPYDEVDWHRIRRLYAADVNHVDRLFGQVIDLLKKHGRYDQILLIVTSDHGENIGDHDLMNHQYGLWETSLGVPLVIRAPGRLSPGVRADPVMLSDLFATILDAAGLTYEDPRPYSNSLLGSPGAGPRPVVAEYAGADDSDIAHLKKLNPRFDEGRVKPACATVRRDAWRLTRRSDGSEALHNLATDPGQLRDVIADNREEAAQLAKLLSPIPSTWPHGQGLQQKKLDEDAKEKLRSLGYAR